MKAISFSRRKLLFGTLTSAIAAPFMTLALKSQTAWAQMKAFVSEGDPVAKALKYVALADAAKPDARKDKPDWPAKKQYCDNCLQYNPIAAIGGKPAGKCNMIQGGAVEPKGWCSVWVAKPGAKAGK